jgi:hypothetical protein
MKKSILTLAAMAVSSMGVFAQGYYYFKNTGVPDGYSFSAPSTGATAIITGTASAQSNMLSAAQNLPFAFSLYGLNVSQFKASTSGYITFDVSATADNQTNVALPSASAPKMAIFGFWDKTRIQTLTNSNGTYPSSIKSWITGTAPNRVFHIQWQLIQTDDGTSATNVTYYAILLNENGTFDIVHDYGFGTFTATTGVQNVDGTAGTMIDGSPNMNFGGANGSYDASKSVVYSFRYGVQPAIDLEVPGELTPQVAGAASGGATIKVKTVNYGSTNITSAKMNYSINNGTPVTSPVTVSIDKNAGRATISHPTVYVPSNTDANTTKTVRVWFSEINGGSEYSDTLAFDIFNNKGVTGTKRVFIEEGSGAWCGYCPDGHYRLKGILEANPDKVVAVVHHNSDLMAFTASETINSRFATGYPYGMVDRVLYDDQTTVGLNRGLWAEKVTEQLSSPTPVNVSIINKNFDWATGKVTYTVKVEFVDYAKPGDIRISTFIKEDKVRGPNVEPTSSQKGWNQHNYYTYEAGYQVGGSSHPLFTEPFNIIGYWHNEVVRNIPSGSWGTSGVITDASLGKVYTFDYSHTMTAATSVVYENSSTSVDTDYRSQKNGRGWNKYEDTKIVAFVNYYDAANPDNMSVMNVTETTMINTGVNELSENTIGEVSVYPNPTNGLSTIDFSLISSSTVKIEVVNVLGQKVAEVAAGSYTSGSHSVNFDASKLTSGIYFVNITSENGKATSRFVVSK